MNEKNTDHLLKLIDDLITVVKKNVDNINKAVERIDITSKHLSDKEVMWVMSLLTFEKLLDIVEDSQEFGKYTSAMKERTLQ